jgi:hypothetical protein
MTLHGLKHWWHDFKAQHIAAPDPNDWGRPITAAHSRVVLTNCQRPWGTAVKGARTREPVIMGWRVFAHNDGERVEVLLAWLRSRTLKGSLT